MRFAIVGCPDPCSLDDFLAFLEPLKIEDWDAACDNGLPTGPSEKSTGK